MHFQECGDDLGRSRVGLGGIVEKGNAKSGGCQLWATSVATNHETYDDRKVIMIERR
jgi:hypothetical protein